MITWTWSENRGQYCATHNNLELYVMQRYDGRWNWTVSTIDIFIQLSIEDTKEEAMIAAEKVAFNNP